MSDENLDKALKDLSEHLAKKINPLLKRSFAIGFLFGVAISMFIVILIKTNK